MCDHRASDIASLARQGADTEHEKMKRERDEAREVARGLYRDLPPSPAQRLWLEWFPWLVEEKPDV